MKTKAALSWEKVSKDQKKYASCSQKFTISYYNVALMIGYVAVKDVEFILFREENIFNDMFNKQKYNTT